MSKKTEARDRVVDAALAWYASGQPTTAHSAALARACRDLLDVLRAPGWMCVPCEGGQSSCQHAVDCPVGHALRAEAERIEGGGA